MEMGAQNQQNINQNLNNSKTQSVNKVKTTEIVIPIQISKKKDKATVATTSFQPESISKELKQLWTTLELQSSAKL